MDVRQEAAGYLTWLQTELGKRGNDEELKDVIGSMARFLDEPSPKTEVKRVVVMVNAPKFATVTVSMLERIQKWKQMTRDQEIITNVFYVSILSEIATDETAGEKLMTMTNVIRTLSKILRESIEDDEKIKYVINVLVSYFHTNFHENNADLSKLSDDLLGTLIYIVKVKKLSKINDDNALLVLEGLYRKYPKMHSDIMDIVMQPIDAAESQNYAQLILMLFARMAKEEEGRKVIRQKSLKKYMSLLIQRATKWNKQAILIEGIFFLLSKNPRDPSARDFIQYPRIAPMATQVILNKENNVLDTPVYAAACIIEWSTHLELHDAKTRGIGRIEAEPGEPTAVYHRIVDRIEEAIGAALTPGNGQNPAKIGTFFTVVIAIFLVLPDFYKCEKFLKLYHKAMRYPGVDKNTLAVGFIPMFGYYVRKLTPEHNDVFYNVSVGYFIKFLNDESTRNQALGTAISIVSVDSALKLVAPDITSTIFNIFITARSQRGIVQNVHEKEEEFLSAFDILLIISSVDGKLRRDLIGYVKELPENMRIETLKTLAKQFDA